MNNPNGINREPLNEPLVFVPLGCCPECGGLLTVVDVDITTIELNKDGDPMNEHTMNKCKAVCPRCGHKLEMVRWKGKYIPYSPVNYNMLVLEEIEKSKENIKDINKSMKNPMKLDV